MLAGSASYVTRSAATKSLSPICSCASFSSSLNPNDNRATVVIPQEEFLKYLAAVGNSYEFIELY